MTRRVGMVLVLLLMSCFATTFATTSSLAASATQSGDKATVLTDPDDDVKFDENDEGGTILKGNYGGDIRTVKAAVQDKRVVVRVAFDHVRYSGMRLNVVVALPASKDGLSYVASLIGNTSAGVPTKSLVQVASGSDESDPVDCEGFKVKIELDQWSFSVPKVCLQPQEFERKALIVQTSFKYDNGMSYDRLPASGKTWFS